MMRGTFANVRIRNLMLPADAEGRQPQGGYTLFDGQQTTVFAAAMRHLERGTPTLIFAGEEYGTGSSRDWAAKGTRLLGVRAVIARSYERIHRANLVGMGVLPLQFVADDSVTSLDLRGDETFDILGIGPGLLPMQALTLVIERANGERSRTPVAVPHRYGDRGQLLPIGRHPALRSRRTARSICGKHDRLIAAEWLC
jgi:aconitate hydratase